MNRGRVVEPWTKITVQRRVAGSLNYNMEGWLVESNCISKNQSGCLQVARVIANVHNGMIPVRVANYSSQTVRLQKGKLLAPEQVEVVGNISNTKENSEKFPDHLQLLYEEMCNSNNFDKDTQIEIWKLLVWHQNIFAKNKKDIGQTSIVLHDIDIGNASPVKRAPRRPPFTMSHILEDNIKDLLNRDLIIPLSSGWASPVILVKKKDGGVRFCIDFRKLNSETKLDAYLCLE